MIEHAAGIDWQTLGQAMIVAIVAGALNAAIIIWVLKKLTVSPKQQATTGLEVNINNNKGG